MCELIEGESGREGGNFVIRKIDFDEFGKTIDKVKVLPCCPVLREDEHLHLFGLFD